MRYGFNVSNKILYVTICPGLQELSVVLSQALNFQWHVKALPYLGASFWIWQCTSVTRHFVPLVIPLSQGTSRVMHAGHTKASDHRCPVWESFTMRFTHCCASKFTTCTLCPFLVPMAYWVFLVCSIDSAYVA